MRAGWTAAFDLIELGSFSTKSRLVPERCHGARNESAWPWRYVGKLAAAPEVDIVTVTVRVPHHLEVVNTAIGAGKHVYCEWPLGPICWIAPMAPPC
ncbi:MAG TPA: Gfo/Idh/MocA family oxidoreductase [Xanthobacteraceae bacterium]|nr:Gfo/Idh/MocA family oxidoreductase [Xanthobacteraceae bacterium]